MFKVDYKKVLKQYYGRAATQVVAVDVPPMNFVVIDGHAMRGTSLVFQDAVATLHSLRFESSGGRLSGKHHKIYSNDFRRTAPVRLKTVLRHPFTL